MQNKKVLVVDDEESIRWILKKGLEKVGFSVEVAQNGREALSLINDQDFSVVFLDIKLPDASGLELIDKFRVGINPPQIIVMTAQDTMKNAIEAMKKGAFDYITKPFDIDEIELITKKAIENLQQGEELHQLRDLIKTKKYSDIELIGKSKAIKEIFKTIGKISKSDVTVLIQGESGTGKELIARIIHQNSKRATGPFIAINSAAIPKELLESEMFGHEKGAFTGATEKKIGKFSLANRGTIFFDEIAEMPIELQSKLLRVIQEMEFEPLGSESSVKVDVRIIVATNKNLEDMVKKGKFREDLFYRFNVVMIEVPPLRERKSDIPLLIEHFLEKFCQELEIGEKSISEDALKLLIAYLWPGNIRELENAIKRAILLSSGQMLLPEDFPQFLLVDEKPILLEQRSLEEIVHKKLSQFINRLDTSGTKNLYDIVIPRIERPLIKLILEKTKGNQLKAAKILGVNRNTLRKKIKELGINAKD